MDDLFWARLRRTHHCVSEGRALCSLLHTVLLEDTRCHRAYMYMYIVHALADCWQQGRLLLIAHFLATRGQRLGTEPRKQRWFTTPLCWSVEKVATRDKHTDRFILLVKRLLLKQKAEG